MCILYIFITTFTKSKRKRKEKDFEALKINSLSSILLASPLRRLVKSLEKRIHKAGLSDRLETRVCQHNSLGMDDVKVNV
uniref:Uncharacterized protein n=1 Tax=Candidatus Methanophaga sp. ANME-1 ERB7 TaxID=2759913 RepID=A0A7G9ZBI2_9EURY|nr:hypothetical protein LCMFKOLL_00012 [Methanosarcinales archaeon ANME-1 ERB7]